MRTFVELFIRCIHLTVAIIWVGGVMFSTLIAMPIFRQNLQARDLLEIHNRFRHWIRLMIHVLLITGGIVIFIVAWNNDMQLKATYMVYAVAKLAAFGFLALFWGLYSSLYRRYLESTSPDHKITVPRHINVFGYLTLFSGFVVFALALQLKN